MALTQIKVILCFWHLDGAYRILIKTINSIIKLKQRQGHTRNTKTTQIIKVLFKGLDQSSPGQWSDVLLLKHVYYKKPFVVYMAVIIKLIISLEVYSY